MPWYWDWRLLAQVGFAKVLVGLSGGVDSALTATVARDALGPDNVVGIAMPSRYSSEGSLSDARELADNLGIELWNVPMEPAHLAFGEILEPFFRGTEPNVAEGKRPGQDTRQHINDHLQ